MYLFTMAEVSSSHIEISVGQEASAEIHSKTFILVLVGRYSS
jgi:hypothetical protein